MKKYYQQFHDFEEQELKDLLSLLNCACGVSNGKGVNVHFEDKQITLITELVSEQIKEVLDYET